MKLSYMLLSFWKDSSVIQNYCTKIRTKECEVCYKYPSTVLQKCIRNVQDDFTNLKIIAGAKALSTFYLATVIIVCWKNIYIEKNFFFFLTIKYR